MQSSEPRLGSVRRPRLVVHANGAAVDNAVWARVLSNSHYAADRFTFAASLGEARPAAWMSAGRLEIEIGATLGQGSRTLIRGEADDIRLDAVRRVVHVAGRDLTARLIEARTQESFANRTASEIATLLAARRGLAARVARTETPVGRYWQLQRDRITLDRFSRTTTEWDLLAMLAALEGFDAWVDGATLHFAPRAEAAPGTVLRAAPGPWGPANVTALRLERALTLARDIEVIVKSWSSRQQQSFTRRARRRGTRSGEAQRYVLVVPNLAPDEAQALAQRKLADLTRHERTIIAEMPGELDLTPRHTVRVEGTGTDFDQTYRIDEIERTLHASLGFSQTLRARNSSRDGRPATAAA